MSIKFSQLAMVAALVLASGVANAQRHPNRPARTAHVSPAPATEEIDPEYHAEVVVQRDNALGLAQSSTTALGVAQAELAQLRREQAENHRLLAQQAEALRNLSARPQENPQPQARTRATWTPPTPTTVAPSPATYQPPPTPQPTVYRSNTQANGGGSSGLTMSCSLPANVLDTLFIGGVRGLRSGQPGTITLMVHGMYYHGFSAWVNGHAVTPVYGGGAPCALVETNGGDSAAIPFVPPIPADGITNIVGPTGQEEPSEVRLEIYSVLPGITRLQRSCTIIIPNVSPRHRLDVREINGQVMVDEFTCSR